MNDLPNVTKECETESIVVIKIYLSIQPIDLENGILRVAACLNRIAMVLFASLANKPNEGKTDIIWCKLYSLRATNHQH